MASLMSPPYFDVGAGIAPADGAFLFFNVVGSEVDKDTFPTAAATPGTEHTNPVEADSKGVFPAIYLVGDYDWVLTDKNLVQQNTGSVSSEGASIGGLTNYEFLNVANMVAGLTIGGDTVNLSEGLSLTTQGYYTAGDAGGASYISEGPQTVDGLGDHLLDSGNTAIMQIFNGSLNVKQFGAKGTAIVNDRPSCQAAVDALFVDGGDVLFPGGVNDDYLLTGIASPDSHLNGILVPFNGFTIRPKIRLIAQGSARLRAGSNNMMLVRASAVGTECIGLSFEGASKTDVWAMGCVPEDRDQLITQVSQSYCKMISCNVDNCEEGFVGEPGPTVGGSDSGCFYLKVLNCDMNLTNRQVWLKGSISSLANRVTRTIVQNCTLLRGNVGVDMEYSTEGTFSNNYFEFFDVLRGGTSPLPVPSAYHLGAKSQNNNIYSGSAEACDLHINNEATSTNNTIDGFPLSGINFNIGVMPQRIVNRLQLTDDISGVDRAVDVTFKNDGFAKIEADSLGSGSINKDVVLSTNGADRTRWFDGEMTHYGSVGNLILADTGNLITSSATSLAISSGGFVRFVAASDGVYFRIGATDIVKVESDSFRPIADNITNLGEGSFRWAQVYAGIGAINTSDARHKTEVRAFTNDEMTASKELSKEIGFYKFLQSVEDKGDDARNHVGMTVQRAIEIMEANNLDPFNYGFICFDEWDEVLAKDAVYLEQGAIIQAARGDKPVILADGTELVSEAVEGKPAGNIFSFRPDQLDRFIIKGLEQRLTDAGI